MAVGLCGLASVAEAAPAPAAAYGRLPEVTQAVISPDGRHVAILGGPPERRTLSVATLDSPDLPSVALGDVETISVRWAGDKYVLAKVAYWERSDPRHTYRMERNLSFTTEAKPVTGLLTNDSSSAALVRQTVVGVTDGPQPRALVLGLAPSGGAIGAMDTRLKRKGDDAHWVMALWSVDPATGKGVIVERGDFDTQNWDVDETGQPRIRLNVNDVTHAFALMGRAKGTSTWTKLSGGGDLDAARDYLGYSAPEDAVYLAGPGGILRKRLSDGVTTPVGKGGDLVWDELRIAPVGIVAADENSSITWLDPEIGAVSGALAKVFKGRSVSLHNWSRDRTRFVLRVTSPSSPSAWYLFDKQRKELSPLGDEYPQLKDEAHGETRSITYKARDGLTIPAYLTLPPGAKPAGKAALVVLPHGGPASRDSFEFDYLAQFIASRGYAVLQPQFRGSRGFGAEFEKAGYGEWGGKIQTDLLDGVAHVAASGAVDASRTCIVGASFGGYSALASAAFFPDSYKCAASIAGISDLGLLLVEEGRYYGPDSASLDSFRTVLGAATPAKIGATSPARHADAVKVPVLLIHGDRDTVVEPEQSDKMLKALKAAGKPVEMVVLQGENHYLSRSATRTQTLEALETFLARNLPVAP